jgi:hypothetical protein
MSSQVDISLGQLALAADYPRHKIKYFLSFLTEIEAKKFVADICQVAYDLGFNDAMEHKGELDSAPKEAQP